MFYEHSVDLFMSINCTCTVCMCTLLSNVWGHLTITSICGPLIKCYHKVHNCQECLWFKKKKIILNIRPHYKGLSLQLIKHDNSTVHKTGYINIWLQLAVVSTPINTFGWIDELECQMPTRDLLAWHQYQILLRFLGINTNRQPSKI